MVAPNGEMSGKFGFGEKASLGHVIHALVDAEEDTATEELCPQLILVQDVVG